MLTAAATKVDTMDKRAAERMIAVVEFVVLD